MGQLLRSLGLSWVDAAWIALPLGAFVYFASIYFARRAGTPGVYEIRLHKSMAEQPNGIIARLGILGMIFGLLILSAFFPVLFAVEFVPGMARELATTYRLGLLAWAVMFGAWAGGIICPQLLNNLVRRTLGEARVPIVWWEMKVGNWRGGWR